MTDAEESKGIKTNLPTAAVARVSVKVPAFWKPDPKIWFLQLEAQFRNVGITVDQTKYDYVISSIEPDILSQVSDILLNPPQDSKYQAIKDRLISLYADSETQKTQKLLSELELGDKKPSQLLCEMRNLASDKVADTFLKTLWLQRLPVNMRSIISVSSEDLATVATMADKIWELNPIAPQIAATSSITVNMRLIENLQKQISELSLQVSTLAKQRPSRPYHRYRSESRNRSYSGNRHSDICYYHKKFGDKAFKCKQPCTFASGSQTNNWENSSPVSH